MDDNPTPQPTDVTDDTPGALPGAEYVEEKAIEAPKNEPVPEISFAPVPEVRF